MVVALLVSSLTGCQNEPVKEESKVENENNEEGKNEEKESELEKVTFILDYLPNTNHTGIYTALEKGYFKEEGLEVEIIQPASTDIDPLIAKGEGDLGVSFQERVTLARTAKNPLPIKAVAAIIQHNTSGFAAPVEKSIKSPKDFEGKIYGSWGTDLERAFLKTVMEKENADFEKLEILDLETFDFFTSVKNTVDFQWIFYGWDGIAAEVKDFPIDFIKLQDVDPKLDFYTPVIITNEEMIKNRPEVIRKFLKAATKGYEFAIENPEEAVENLLKHAPETDKEIAVKSQKYLAQEFKKDAERWGEMKLEIWETFGGWMYENGLLEKELNAKEAFTNEFLPEK
ncbi:ABC-type nitrate/sulfonate/bicarbonate transport system, substrate-binding protein [Maledivibacter halophilus]|uniref:ABC-type nitrate/sulfonate/bicarbonate transport system, substrate-binding protein n=1 Tax=Maledivibacter halophilus TaxID=36842 RepID=A0A1T5M1U0_9FIRM|nr:ABC-type nitrate/sulfonate/bicarbonate transport system, substrate-binding protein [Maledivibacter halophilus]